MTRPAADDGPLMPDELAGHAAAQVLPRSTPEEQGVDPRGIAALVAALAGGPPTQELRSLVVVRHGHVVAEGARAPYATDRPTALYSLSKTFTATAVGFAVDEGLLRLDDLVVDLAPDDVPTSGLSDDERARLGRLTVRDLLTMRSGHDTDPSEEVFPAHRWVARFLELPLAHEPGTHFVYNTAATAVLAALVERAAGVGLLDYVRPRLLDPLGFGPSTWELSPEGHVTGGFGLSARTRDVAAFGELLLRDGVWQGERLLPQGWVALASQAHVPPGTAPGDERSDWAQGYGFQMWRSRHGYRGDGAFGQYCLVLPEQDMVVAMSSAVGGRPGPPGPGGGGPAGPARRGVGAPPARVRGRTPRAGRRGPGRAGAGVRRAAGQLAAGRADVARRCAARRSARGVRPEPARRDRRERDDR